MKCKRCIISTLAVFLFVFLFEFLVHAFLMMGMYEATSSVWRPQGDGNMLFLFLGQFLYAVFLTSLYSKVTGISCPCKTDTEGKKKCTRCKGLCIGLMVGGCVAATQVGSYCYLPIPISIMLSWVVAELVKGLGSGLILSFTYKDNC